MKLQLVFCDYLVFLVCLMKCDIAQQGNMPRERCRSEGSHLGGEVYLYGVRVCGTRLPREPYFS